MIRIELAQSTVCNGERLKGRVVWEGSKTPRRIEVVCRWRIEGRGKGREEEIDRAESEGTSVPFDFEIPKEGPLTYDGTLLRILWEVVAEADVPRARDEEAVAGFAVVARKWDPAEWA